MLSNYASIPCLKQLRDFEHHYICQVNLSPVPKMLGWPQKYPLNNKSFLTKTK